MKLTNVPTKILVAELVRREFIEDLHVVRIDPGTIELIHPLPCRADGITSCEYAFAMMIAIENMQTNGARLPIDGPGMYAVDLKDGKLTNWRMV